MAKKPTEPQNMTATEVQQRQGMLWGRSPAVQEAMRASTKAARRENWGRMRDVLSTPMDPRGDIADAMQYGYAPRTHNQSALTLHIERDPGSLAIQVRSRDRASNYQVNTVISQDELNHAPLREVIHRTAREHAQQYTQQIERVLCAQLEEALTPRDGRDRGRLGDMMQHGLDVARGWGGSTKPEKTEPITALAEYQKVIEADGFVATLLDDTMKVWDEAQKMGHCLYKSYLGRLQRGDYVVYHVKCPNSVSRGGVTLGFDKANSNWARPSLDVADLEAWRVDQVKAKNNGRKNNKRLDDFCDIVCNIINGKQTPDNGAKS